MAVANDYQYAKEIMRLQDGASECRLRVVESEVSVALTLCALAETEILCGRPDEALKFTDKLRHEAVTIRKLLDEPGYLPRIEISHIRQQLTQLEKRAAKIESRVHPL